MILFLITTCFPTYAGETGLSKGPIRWSLGIGGGENWSPDTSDVDFISIHLSATFDRDPFFSYEPAKRLRWLLEAQAGSTVHHSKRLITSVGMLIRAQSDPISGVIGYGLAGIGIIYTDFQVPGQGLRVNFAPQLGLGIDIKKRIYLQVRWHHISNGGLHKDNTGINHWLLYSGVYF